MMVSPLNETAGNDMEKRDSKALMLMVILTFVMAGFIVVYSLFMEERQFFFICLAIMVLSICLLFIDTERRRPRTGEVVVVASMVTIAVISRAAFFMLPQVKPIAAVVIITGVALGPRIGFLTGALSAFISNFFFAQGPWTPCQMFALGMTGMISAAIIRKSSLFVRPLPMALIGGVCTFIVYGGIVDLWTAFGFNPEPTPGSALTVYAMALPLDAVFAVTTALILFFIGIPMIKKLDRVKTRYGMFRSMA
ncbi:MAG: ECF transporter S component [Bacillota bacterium]|nr:ECF transporter S component [Bacillota bacterium]